MSRNIQISLVLLPTLLFISLAHAGPRKGPGVQVEGVRFIDSHQVQINFQTAANSAPLKKVTLYVSRDKGATWEQWNGPATIKPPISYDASDDGLFGFYIVLENDAGMSSPPPRSGIAPQQWVRIDTKPPVVQLLALRADPEFAKNREVRIRWRAEDENLQDRPITLHYRTEESKVFVAIAESQPGTSEYRWTIPEGVHGRVEIKITAQDLAGKITEYKTDRLSVDGAVAQVQAVTLTGDANLMTAASEKSPEQSSIKTVQAGYHEPDADGRPASPQASLEAKKLFEQGTYHRIRGELDLAAIRYEEAVKLDSDYLDAWHDLAGIHLLQGRYAEARKIFSLILNKDPHHRGAMKGLALVQTSEKNYKSARQTLERLLLLTPLDAEAWLYYGDVAMFSGDRIAARDAWSKASTIDKVDSETRRRAQKRLDMYPGHDLALNNVEP
jgi:hypothetical protein